MQDPTPKPSWEQILLSAVHEPGIVHEAYRRFWNYSLGNQLLAMLQCQARGIQPGPIATFQKWKELGRAVKKGEKALSLILPVTVRSRRIETDSAAADEAELESSVRTIFVLKKNWFVLAQTEGREYVPQAPARWDEARALATLDMAREEFSSFNGNAQGYATPRRSVAVSPVAALPYKTLFHELGHVLLGHTEFGEWSDSETISRSLQEAEAEAVALLCCESLGLPGAEYSRGYIQHWLSGDPIPERSARRIVATADRILKAGICDRDRANAE